MTTDLIVPSNPTPNGDLHVGHIAGPFLGADLLRRAAAQRSERAAVMLGTAWQNTHVLLAARQRGQAHLAVAAEYAAQIEASFAAVGIGYDVMLEHADIPDIEQVTRAAFNRLAARGTLTVRDATAQYCTTCDDWRFQGFVAGRCPHCGGPDASGIDCEGCALYHDDAELVEPVCTVCGGATATRPLRRAFLDLESERAWFENYLASADLGPAVRRYAETVLAGRLPAVAVSFIGEPGIPLDGADLAGQRIYPSFELAPRYAVMLRRFRAAGGEVGPDTRISMLFGYDNAFERVFLFPAVQRALEPDAAPLPTVLQMTYFYLLDGSKFSTSRGHVVGVRELVESSDADSVRLYLAATRPEANQTNFTRTEFAASAPARTVGLLRQWAATGRLPAGADPGGPGDLGWPELAQAAGQLDAALRPQRLSGVRAADSLLRLVAIAIQAHARPDGAELRGAALHCLVNGAAALIPDTAAQLRAAFAVPAGPFDGTSRPAAGSAPLHRA